MESTPVTQKKPSVLMVVTTDTKAAEARYLRDLLEAEGIDVVHLDPSVRPSADHSAEITPDAVARAAGATIQQVRDLRHEGKCLDVMTNGAIQAALALHAQQGLSGVIGIGGSMGTSLATQIMQRLPYGLPKVMVSTMASGFTRPFVGAKDIVMFNPVCDIAGLNSITRDVYRNAAFATAAMAKHYVPTRQEAKPLVAMSTLGVIDRCTVRVREQLEQQGYEVMVFHTQGTGGMAMDQIVAERDVAVVVDVSLVEIAEYLNHGLLAGLPDRSKAALDKGTPVIYAPGNIDFIVAGPIEAAQQQYPGRRYHMHNPSMTAVRTNAAEMQRTAAHMAGLIASAQGPVSFFVPLQGFSHHDSPEGYIHDPAMCRVFADALRGALPAGREVTEFDAHINDAVFADAIVQQVLTYTRTAPAAAL